MPAEVIVEELAVLLPQEQPRQLFTTLLNWGRYGEVFGYARETDSFTCRSHDLAAALPAHDDPRRRAARRRGGRRAAPLGLSLDGAIARPAARALAEGVSGAAAIARRDARRGRRRPADEVEAALFADGYLARLDRAAASDVRALLQLVEHGSLR